MRDHLQKSAEQDEMYMVSDMITNFYKSIVYINQTEFPKCIFSSNDFQMIFMTDYRMNRHVMK